MSDAADPAAAKADAQQAEAAFDAARATLRQVEARDAGGSELSGARRNRSATALAWRKAAAAWVDAAHGEPAAQAALKKASAAADRYEMPSGGLKGGTNR